MKKIFLFGILFLLLQTAATAFGNSQAAFDVFRKLKGKWVIQSEGKTLPIQMTYDDGSKDSIVTEQFGKELSVIYRDGTELLITHFCNAGNQPRLKMVASNRPDFIEFEMFDITNLKTPDSAHVQKIIYKMVDSQNIDLEIIWKAGSEQESEKYSLKKM